VAEDQRPGGEGLKARIEAARLLGRWTLIAERHGNGCSCCPPGLGDAGIEEVERRVLAWLRPRHAGVGESFPGFLKDCISGKTSDAAPFPDIDEALDELEFRQSGLYQAAPE
jgi:hypothetical protein